MNKENHQFVKGETYTPVEIKTIMGNDCPLTPAQLGYLASMKLIKAKYYGKKAAIRVQSVYDILEFIQNVKNNPFASGESYSIAEIVKELGKDNPFTPTQIGILAIIGALKAKYYNQKALIKIQSFFDILNYRENLINTK